jgi:outer membrane receptor protein involved in Fe transport
LLFLCQQLVWFYKPEHLRILFANFDRNPIAAQYEADQAPRSEAKMMAATDVKIRPRGGPAAARAKPIMENHPMAYPTWLWRNTRAMLLTSVFASAGLGAGVAVAQQQAASGTAETLEEVVVTGTRIASPNASSSSPIVAVSREDLALQGIHDTGDLVDLLPQNITTSIDLSNTNNPLSGPGGVTTMNLRGLGPQRTLVLVDGRRLGVGDPNTGNPNPAPDINQIPAALIERVDVVTGGASAVYGSDAVAGVVNFIMRRNFEGVQIDAQYGFDQHNQHNDYMQGLVRARGLPLPDSNVTDGFNRSFSITVGGNFADDKGNATAYFSFLDQDPTTLAQRDFSSCQLSSEQCAGSSNSNRFRNLNGGSRLAVVGDQFVPWSSTAATTPPPLFNSNPYMNLLHGGERYQAGTFLKYDWNQHAQMYADFMFMNDRSKTAVAPSGLFTTDLYTLNCNNPLMTDQQRTAIGCTPAMIANGDSIFAEIGRRNIEGGPRQFGYEHTNYRAMVGVKGNMNDQWTYDAYASYYYTTLYTTNQNYISKSRTQSAMNGCVDGASGCVPYNIFQEGAVTPEALNYIAAYGVSNGTTSQEILSASTTGDLGGYGMKLPTANEGVAIALGLERRVDGFAYLPDQTLGSGDLSGSGGASPTIDSSTGVTELFGELRVPLVQGKKGAEDLIFEAGYRYSDYELSGGVSTYKFGLQWAPINDIRLRGSFNRAIRAPSLIELFNPQSVTQTSDVAIDPCAPTILANGTVVPPTATLEQCQRTGVTAAQYAAGIPQCVSNQCSVLTGGNEQLKPETADTLSLGFTVTPGALPDFTASVDWYQIKLKDIISNIPLDVSMSGCLNGTNLAYCANIVRNQFGAITGSSVESLGYIVGTNANIAEATFSGIDIQGSYRFGLGSYGSLVTTLNAVYLDKTTTVPLPGEHEYDCAGLYGPTCDAPLPTWRHTWRFTWNMPWKVQASLQWRYIGSVSLETNTSDPTLGDCCTEFGSKLGARSYFDLSGNWDVTEGISLRAGINNILDQDPPLVDTNWTGPGTPNTWGPYDTLGRQIFMAVTAKF